MENFSALLVLAVIVSLGCVSAVPETTKHGSHGSEAHKSAHFKGGKHNTVYDYEALMGSHEYDDLAELPEDVRRNRLTILAKSHDTNSNGLIESGELHAWVLHSFKMLDHQEGQERRKDDDEDGDGKVTFHEILKKQYGYSQEDIDGFEKDPNAHGDEELEMVKIVKDDKLRFAAADLNQDNFLDVDEYLAYYQPYDHPHMHSLEMDRQMKEMDEDHDGFVGMSEFIKASPEDQDDYHTELTSFNDLDKDKDGKLTSDELKPWALYDNAESAQEEVDHLIKECDDNEDGHLSIEEIVNKEEDFIASHVTDYGRHLHFVKEEL